MSLSFPSAKWVPVLIQGAEFECWAQKKGHVLSLGELLALRSRSILTPVLRGHCPIITQFTGEAGGPLGLSDLSRVSYGAGAGGGEKGREKGGQAWKMLESQGWAKLCLSVLFTHPLASSSARQREPVLGLGLGKHTGPSQGGLSPCVTPLPSAIPSAGQGALPVPRTLLLPSPYGPTLQRGSRPHR